MSSNKMNSKQEAPGFSCGLYPGMCPFTTDREDDFRKHASVCTRNDLYVEMLYKMNSIRVQKKSETNGEYKLYSP